MFRNSTFVLTLCLVGSASAGTITRTAPTTAQFDYHWDSVNEPSNIPAPIEFAKFDFRDAPLSDISSLDQIDISFPGGAYTGPLTEGPGWFVMFDGASAELGTAYKNDPSYLTYKSLYDSQYAQVLGNLMADGMLAVKLGPAIHSGGIYMSPGTATLSISGPDIVPEPSSWVLLLLGVLAMPRLWRSALAKSSRDR
jgi:hypothetical protein